MKATTPAAMTEVIRDFCRSIEPATEPTFVIVRPWDTGEVKECFDTTSRYAAQHGGSIQYGWTIWETPGVLLDAEFHAVWRDQSGSLLDVTPKLDGEPQILFLPDTKRVWANELVKNVRRILRDSPELQDCIQTADLIYEIKCKHFSNGQIDAEAATQELREVLLRSGTTPVREAGRVGRNAPCPCGSERKFKKCCGAT